MNKTIFEKIIDKEIPAEIVYEDDDFIAFLDIKPVSLGHTLLVPKIACENIFEIDSNSADKLGHIMKKVSLAVKSGSDALGINIIANNGEAAGQEIFHLHFHIIPRFENDGLESWHGKTDSGYDLPNIAKKIRGFF